LHQSRRSQAAGGDGGRAGEIAVGARRRLARAAGLVLAAVMRARELDGPDATRWLIAALNTP